MDKGASLAIIKIIIMLVQPSSRIFCIIIIFILTSIQNITLIIVNYKERRCKGKCSDACF